MKTPISNESGKQISGTNVVACILRSAPGGGLELTKVPLIEIVHAAPTADTEIRYDYSKDVEVPNWPVRTLAEILTMLEVASSADKEAISQRHLDVLVAEARSLPDVAQAPQSAMPPWSLSHIRKSTRSRVSSRYVFVPELSAVSSAGVYHVDILHQGATVIVSRTSRFQDRMVHDPVGVSPDEFDRVAFGFLKVFAYLQDPVKNFAIGHQQDTPEFRVSLGAAYASETGQMPFGAVFGGSAAEAEQVMPTSKSDSLFSTGVEPTVSYRRRKI